MEKDSPYQIGFRVYLKTVAAAGCYLDEHDPLLIWRVASHLSCHQTQSLS